MWRDGVVMASNGGGIDVGRGEGWRGGIDVRVRWRCGEDVLIVLG